MKDSPDARRAARTEAMLLRKLLIRLDDVAIERGEAGLMDEIGNDGVVYQSGFAAALIAVARSRREGTAEDSTPAPTTAPTVSEEIERRRAGLRSTRRVDFTTRQRDLVMRLSLDEELLSLRKVIVEADDVARERGSLGACDDRDGETCIQTKAAADLIQHARTSPHNCPNCDDKIIGLCQLCGILDWPERPPDLQLEGAE